MAMNEDVTLYRRFCTKANIYKASPSWILSGSSQGKNAMIPMSSIPPPLVAGWGSKGMVLVRKWKKRGKFSFPFALPVHNRWELLSRFKSSKDASRQQLYPSIVAEGKCRLQQCKLSERKPGTDSVFCLLGRNADSLLFQFIWLISSLYYVGCSVQGYKRFPMDTLPENKFMR